MKVCLKCGNSVIALTRDHRIPRWLVKRISYLGFKQFSEHKLKKRNAEMAEQLICATCNMAKGGNIDWTDTLTREFMAEFAEAILAKLKS